MNFLIPGFTDILDIIIVSVIVYSIIQLFKKNNGYYIIVSLSLLVIFYFVVSYFHLEMMFGILKGIQDYWILGLLVIFAPEIRRAMTQTLQRRNLLNFFFRTDKKSNYEAIIDATSELAMRRMGALIVFEKNQALDDYVFTSGEIIDSNISTRLLVSCFWPNSPLHDGALVIRKNRIYAAKVVLPLSKNIDYIDKLGTRHLAAIGITEASDAYCIVASEQTGRISFTVKGEIKRGVSPEELRQLLIDEERV
ncbi:MAG TPA: diadenylate cyclase CdaA [Candidatus Cloacimonadota bacterium]|nr:diadenylate cyclase CdaA [Candidatus Cloacimonadota bacterium]